MQEPGFESENEKSKTEIVMAFLKHQWKKLLISGIVILLISIVICIGVILNGKSHYGNTGCGVSCSAVQNMSDFFLTVKGSKVIFVNYKIELCPAYKIRANLGKKKKIVLLVIKIIRVWFLLTYFKVRCC